jgi:hypothetical protein
MEDYLENRKIIGLNGDFIVFQIDTKCLRDKENKISGDVLKYLNKEDIYLYIINKPFEPLAISQTRSISLSIFGWIFLILISFSLYYIFHKFKKHLDE